VVVRGTLTNPHATNKVYLNDIVPSFSGLSANNLSLARNSFFSNVPGILWANEGYNASELFRLVLDQAAGRGDFSGAILFRGGSDITANDELGSVACQVLKSAMASGGDSALDTAVFAMIRGRSTGSSPAINFQTLTVSFIPTSSGSNYIVEISTDLVNWTPTGVEEIIDANAEGAKAFSYQTTSATPRAFLRLRVTPLDR
jgi:hypothetical protein